MRLILPITKGAAPPLVTVVVCAPLAAKLRLEGLSVSSGIFLAKAARLRPDDLSYQYTLASAKVGKKQFDAAQAIMQKLVAKQPQDSQLQYALGSVLYLEGHLADAASHLTESIRLQPNQLASYYYLALVERDQGHDAEAIP